tara:strand:- start:910 stop:1221 length:312 start_codon:yes stop_codon:yes gene_type:complete
MTKKSKKVNKKQLGGVIKTVKKVYNKGKKYIKSRIAEHKQLMKDVEQFKKENDGASPGPGNDEFWKGRGWGGEKLRKKKKVVKKKKLGGFRDTFLEPGIESID